MKIVEHKNDRSRRGEPREQIAHGAVAAVALVLERWWTVGREPGKRRKDARQLRPHVVVH